MSSDSPAPQDAIGSTPTVSVVIATRDRVELLADEPRGHLVDGCHLARVLRGEGDDRRHAVHARGRERLQIGLDPGPTAGIGARDRDTAWNQRTPFAGMTRIRFDGCDLSPGGAPRRPEPNGAAEAGARPPRG